MTIQSSPKPGPFRANRIASAKATSSFRADNYMVVRYPVLSAATLEQLGGTSGDELARSLRIYLADDYLREALYLASPSLFDRVVRWEKGEGDFNNLQATVARYILRMAYRATPFGTFSCVMGARTASKSEATASVIPDRRGMRRAVQLDSSILLALGRDIERDASLRLLLEYHPNDTICTSLDSVSFMAFERSPKGKRIYRRIVVERSRHLDEAIELARSGITIPQLTARLTQRFSEEAVTDEIAAYVTELIDAQLLCCDGLVDATSARPLDALMAQIPTGTDLAKRLEHVAGLLESMEGSSPRLVPDAYDSIRKALPRIASNSQSARVTKVDLFADANEPVLDDETVRAIEGVVNELVVLTPKASRLSRFIKCFEERFGDTEVPLLTVASELETLGYEEGAASKPELSRLVRSRAAIKQAESSSPIWEMLDRLIGSSLLEKGERYLDISTLIDTQGPSSEAKPPNVSLVAWVALWKSNAASGKPTIEIKSVGSQEPGRVMGRFAHGSESLRDYLCCSAAGGDELVAEIVHLPEDRHGNISFRPATAQYEIRLRAGQPREAKPLPLDDLRVSLDNGRVLIRSVSHAKYVRLQMSSAHAYDKAAHLPIYRFLNHVSNQDFNAEIGELRRRIPKSGFIPGLIYKGIIVSRPTWKLSRQIVDRLRDAPKGRRSEVIQEVRREQRLPQWVTLVQGDNVIPYNLDCDWMVEDLHRTLLQGSSGILSDLSPPNLRPYLRSESGEHFHEIQIALRSLNRPRKPSSFKTEAAYPERMSERFWSEWAYFKIYSPHHLQDEALTQLRGHLEGIVSKGLLDGYFFVRYRDEHGPHLRLRVYRASGSALRAAEPELTPVFESLLCQRLIHDVTIATYVREQSRYGGDKISGYCEQIFCVDSRTILEVIPRISSNRIESWRSLATAMDYMLRALGLESRQERLTFAKVAARDYDAEFEFNTAERRKIGEILAKSPQLFSEDFVHPDIPGELCLRQGIAPIKALWSEAMCSDAATHLSGQDLYRIRWSLVHMRMNRLLSQEARLQEAIVWELLKRSLVTQGFTANRSDHSEKQRSAR